MLIPTGLKRFIVEVRARSLVPLIEQRFVHRDGGLFETGHYHGRQRMKVVLSARVQEHRN